MPTFAYLGPHARRRDRHRRARRPTRWTRPSRRCAASRSWSRASRRPRPRRSRREGRSRASSARRSSAKNLAVFTRQFSVMIDAGLPLVQCLEILGTQEEDKNFAARHPADARPTSRAARRSPTRCSKHPKTFDPLFTNMIAAGEAGGILDTILKRLATYIEKAVKLKGQVKSAMIYPVAVIVIAGRRRRRHSVEGHPDLRRAVRRPRRRAAAADAHRHRAEQRRSSAFVPF